MLVVVLLLVAINTNTRVITLTAANTGTVNGNVIFGEETSVNWVNIDIQRTKTINQSLAGSGGTPGTRLYLYGYTVEASPPTTRVQGFTIGARQDGTGVNAIADKINCLLVSSGASEATTKSASISPYGPSVSGLNAGVAGSPLQYDSATYTINGVAGSVGGWYLSVSATNNTIYTTLSTNTQYNTVNFTPTTFLKRIADGRDLQDRTYRVRYVIDKDKTNPLPRDPISGYVMQPLNSDTTAYSLQGTFYIYDIEVDNHLKEVLLMESSTLPSFMHLLLLAQVISITESSVKTSTKSILRLTETTLLLTLTLLYPSLTTKLSVS